MKLKVIVYYSILILIWGTTWLAIKISLNEGTPPLYGAGLRFLIAGIILFLIVLIRQESLPLNKQAVGIYLLFGCFNFGISYGITYWATQFIYSNLSAIIWAGFPFVVAAFAHFILPEERFTFKKVISIFIGTSGVIMILTQGKELGGDHALIGILAIIFAVILAAWPNVYLKKNHHVVNTLQLNCFSQTLAGILLIGSSFLLEPDQPMIWSQTNIITLGYLALFGSVITWLIYFWLFSHISVTQISYVAFFPPVIAAFIGWIVLDEELTIVAILGAVLVLTGAVLINFTARKAPFSPQPPS